MSRHFFLLYWILYLVIFPSLLLSASFHLMLVGDTNAPELKSAILLDLKNIQHEMSTAAKQAGYDFHVTTFKDHLAIPLSILETIENLPIAEDDVALFYFSGHGFRTILKEGSPWPNFAFVRSYEALDMDNILDLYRKKKPRLLLMIGDCCNNVISELFSPTIIRKEVVDEKSSKEKRKNYQKLFVETKGEIIVAGSIPGEYSWSTTNGGLFTLAFLHHFKAAVVKSKVPSWEEILDLTAEAIAEHQRPYYSILE